MVTFAATNPKARIYKAGWFWYISCVDFWYIIKAGTNTIENGIIGERTLVPWAKEFNKKYHEGKKW